MFWSHSREGAYRSAVALALATALFLVWGVLALGVIGVEGDPADRMYIGVLAVGIIGSVIARFRPHGMTRALAATAIAVGVVAVIALLLGKHESPVTSVGELVGLNVMFAAMFLGSSWLFHRSAKLED
jgi:hypothetical protein